VTFLLAAISIASPIPGFRPMRAERFFTSRMPRPLNFVALDEVGGQRLDEAGGQPVNLLLRKAMALADLFEDRLQRYDFSFLGTAAFVAGADPALAFVIRLVVIGASRSEG
jgi:hypothetical protein